MKKGDLAPDFTAIDQTGATVRLSDMLADGPVVLFFYPKAFTPGCTEDSCHFRDLAVEFAALGAQRVGISADDTTIQARFDDTYQLGIPLLSDPDRAIAKQYGVKRPGLLFQPDIRDRHRPPDHRNDRQRVQHGGSRRRRPRGARLIAKISRDEDLVIGSEMGFEDRVPAPSNASKANGSSTP